MRLQQSEKLSDSIRQLQRELESKSNESIRVELEDDIAIMNERKRHIHI
jgi:uncharacterized protein YbcI